MVVIDSRLKTCDTDQDVAENFNRTLTLMDNKTGELNSKLPIIFATDTEGTLNIKPSDIVDAEGNFLDKIVAFKYIEDDTLTWILQIGCQVDGDNIIIAFGGMAETIMYASTISGDEYFTEAETNSPEIPNVGS